MDRGQGPPHGPHQPAMRWSTRDRLVRVALGVAAAQVVDAIAGELDPRPLVQSHLDHLGVPRALRPALAFIKVTASVGLIVGLRWPETWRADPCRSRLLLLGRDYVPRPLGRPSRSCRTCGRLRGRCRGRADAVKKQAVRRVQAEQPSTGIVLRQGMGDAIAPATVHHVDAPSTAVLRAVRGAGPTPT